MDARHLTPKKSGGASIELSRRAASKQSLTLELPRARAERERRKARSLLGARPATRADAKAWKTKKNDAADSEAAAGIGRKFSAVGRTAVAAARLKVLRARNRVAQCQKTLSRESCVTRTPWLCLSATSKRAKQHTQRLPLTKIATTLSTPSRARVNALRLLKAAVIEGCAAWRLACVDLASATGEDASKNDVARRPFLWNGTNYLLSMITSLDFLATSAALAEWYGPKFSLRRNPFMLAVALDDRPPTPRSAVEEFIIGGEKVLKVNPAKAKQREHDQDALDDAWATIKNGPAYLPACDSDQFFRVRNAERVLIDEENVNSHRVREAYLKNA